MSAVMIMEDAVKNAKTAQQAHFAVSVIWDISCIQRWASITSAWQKEKLGQKQEIKSE